MIVHCLHGFITFLLSGVASFNFPKRLDILVRVTCQCAVRTCCLVNAHKFILPKYMHNHLFLVRLELMLDLCPLPCLQADQGDGFILSVDNQYFVVSEDVHLLNILMEGMPGAACTW